LFVWFFPFHQPSSSVSKLKIEDEVTEPEEPNLLKRMIEALHIELLFVRHRIAVKLANLGQGITGEISLKLLFQVKEGRAWKWTPTYKCCEYLNDERKPYKSGISIKQFL